MHKVQLHACVTAVQCTCLMTSTCSKSSNYAIHTFILTTLVALRHRHSLTPEVTLQLMCQCANRRCFPWDFLFSVCHICLYVRFVITLCVYAQQGYAFGHVGLCTYVGTYVFIYLSTKNRLFSALLPKNLLLSVTCCLLFEFKCLQCDLLRPASYRDRIIHAFPNNTWRSPLAPKYFLLSCNSTPHLQS